MTWRLRKDGFRDSPFGPGRALHPQLVNPTKGSAERGAEVMHHRQRCAPGFHVMELVDSLLEISR